MSSRNKPASPEATPFSLKPVSWAAELLGLSDDTVRRLISRGDIPGYRIGSSLRVKDVDVLAAIEPVMPVSGGHNNRTFGLR